MQQEPAGDVTPASGPRPPRRSISPSGQLFWLILAALTAASGLLWAMAALGRSADHRADPDPTGAAYQGVAGRPFGADEVRSGQGRLTAMIDRLRADADRQPTGQPTGQATGQVPGAQALAGTWSGPNGYRYVIEQYGSRAVVRELNQVGLTAGGDGIVVGSSVSLRLHALDGSSAVLKLGLAGVGQLTGTLTDPAGHLVQAQLRRSG